MMFASRFLSSSFVSVAKFHSAAPNFLRSFFNLSNAISYSPSNISKGCFSRNFSQISFEDESAEMYSSSLRNTLFTDRVDIKRESEPIPIFRILGVDGKLIEGAEAPMSDEQALEELKFMTRLSIYDDLLYVIQRQGRISFYIQNQGEEALQTGIGLALKPEDYLWCQYRELGVLMKRGFTIENALDQCFSNIGDEGKGRQMPISYSMKSLNIPAISTPLTTQVPHASGAGYAAKLSGEDRISVAFFGEGAASEGDCHAAMNFAAVTSSQTFFVCRNNGYAISTPVKNQYVGDGIAIRALALGIKSLRVDGNDLFASYVATKACRELCVKESVPVCAEYMTYRLGHHSTSDDSSQYRPAGEMDIWSRGCYLPITRLRQYLYNKNVWTEEEDKKLRADARAYMVKAIAAAENKKLSSITAGLFSDVYAETIWTVREQAKEFREHLQKHQEKYNTSKYESL